MIISRLSGGLGNQLFQYACGRAFSLASGKELVLDLSGLRSVADNVTRREYELGAFDIQARVATPDEEKRCLQALRWRALSRPIAGLSVLKESPRLYPNVLRQSKGDVLLSGFWQSEKCFANSAAVICRDLTPCTSLSPESLAISQAIASDSSVAVHVRRGDYVTLPSAARFHGTLSMAYYQVAAQRIRERDGEPFWVVFSDDIEWCRGALGFLGGNSLFVGHNQGADSWQDLYLMSLCQHHIIANSSFSWWGAWLSEQRGAQQQMIHAPAKWFAKTDPFALYRIPNRWVRL